LVETDQISFFIFGAENEDFDWFWSFSFSDEVFFSCFQGFPPKTQTVCR